LREKICLLLVTAAVLSACASKPPTPSGASKSPSTSPSSSPTGTPTPPASPKHAPPTRGPASPTCVHGWATPRGTSPDFTDPLGIIRRTTSVRGPLVVVDMRVFDGPESPPSDKGYLLDVRRWYVKLYAKDDPSFQGRFLVESRRFGRGLSAVAPYDTRGWRSPDWRGFQYDEGRTKNRAVVGLPGTWSGVEYDFVEGGAGLNFPGLPDRVVGCLSGT
jgi:hypothetical protein